MSLHVFVSETFIFFSVMGDGRGSSEIGIGGIRRPSVLMPEKTSLETPFSTTDVKTNTVTQ